VESFEGVAGEGLIPPPILRDKSCHAAVRVSDEKQGSVEARHGCDLEGGTVEVGRGDHSRYLAAEVERDDVTVGQENEAIVQTDRLAGKVHRCRRGFVEKAIPNARQQSGSPTLSAHAYQVGDLITVHEPTGDEGRAGRSSGQTRSEAKQIIPVDLAVAIDILL